MPRLAFGFSLWLLLFAVLPSHAQQEPPAQSPDTLAEQRAAAQRAAVIGEWFTTVGNQSLKLSLAHDQTYQLDEQTGSYTVSADMLVLTEPGSENATTYKLTLNNEQMTLASDTLAQPMVFTRQVAMSDYSSWLWDWSAAEFIVKLKRIGLILIIVIGCSLVIRVLRWLSRMVIYSNKGPLQSVFRKHKARALTLHSLGLNLIKYVIYLTAAGMILAELGVNMTTYLASLSVVGLAIGFGSQGLVQDMVTGFFVIFEGQYDVGDMVEISGQIGTVEEIGLRMTRLRNYLGQTVFIPNRNIAVVANFRKGAQHAQIDLAIEANEAERALPMLRTIAERLGDQFRGIIVNTPIIEPRPTASGRTLMRIHLGIWPKQEWVVDQQFVPALRENLAAEQLAIVNDRIAVAYYSR